MGFLKKEICEICKNETGITSRIKLNNGMFICNNCFLKAIPKNIDHNDIISTTNSLKYLSVEELKTKIEKIEKDNEENNSRIEQFTPSYQIDTYIWFDDKHNWFAIPKGKIAPTINKSYIFKYEDIIEFEVLEDGTSITKGGLGKAIVGEAIFGLPGAIAGGTSKKTKEICQKLELKITTRNKLYPIVYVVFTNTPLKKNSYLYKNISKNIEKTLSKFMIITNQFAQEKERKNNNISTSQISIADEIKKFKELLDMGIITQKEFDNKKKELLK